MVNDPIGDMLIQIKNASMAGKSVVELPHSKLKHKVAEVLVREGYVVSIEKIGQEPKFILKIVVKYNGKLPAITDVKRKSKPGLRVYVNADSIRPVVGGLGIAIVSTSQGIMTGKEARNRRLGGEFICEVW